MKTVPFTVLIDTAEDQAFSFEGIKGFFSDQYEILHVPTRYQCLGRYPNSLGDYSIDGFEGRVHVERKSIADIQGTILGWETKHEKENELTPRRDRFKKELENLAKIESGVVVVEGNKEDCLTHMKQYGVKTPELNAKIFNQSYLHLLQTYKVQWIFSGSRRSAEIDTFRWLEWFWRDHKPG